MSISIEGQLCPEERATLRDAVLHASTPPQVIVEVGTWLGGGSTLVFLQAMEEMGAGHLWGIEADASIYERMMENLNTKAAGLVHRFTPLFGLSENVLPKLIAEQPRPFQVDIAFLDGGDNPMEQIREFEILEPLLPVGAQLFSHDARKRKGKFFVPFLSRLDNWKSEVRDYTDNGLLCAQKIAAQPSDASLQKAKARLKQLQTSPLEILAGLVSSQTKAAILRRLPQKLQARLYEGAK